MSELVKNFSAVVHHLLNEPSILPEFRVQFRPQERNPEVIARNLNAAFLIALSGGRLAHPAMGYLSSMIPDENWGGTARCYLDALESIDKELAQPEVQDLNEAAQDLAQHLLEYPDMAGSETVERFRRFFFPEGEGLPGNREQAVRDLRESRLVVVKNMNLNPISKPHEEILFTSNVLLTIPPTLPIDKDIDTLELSGAMKEALEPIIEAEQEFWYDHPIPIGIDVERNEVVHGLMALDEAVSFEIERGNAPSDVRLPVFLSVSATHSGLQELARDYLSGELAKAGKLSHLNIFSASEMDVQKLLDEVLLPAADRFFPDRETEPLREVFGVDGQYGRHYSFLKAFAALWQVLIDQQVRATFKFDLDQVFPQDILVSQTGKSAFEHLSDPLWGSKGVDDQGQAVELGMLAGALVDDTDISEGLFTPDVKWQVSGPVQDQWVFSSTLTQALSTEAEMMTQYGFGEPDGHRSCLQRIHVTGGTTGILIDALRRHRPFTPTWIGRAEDQAFLLSVLFSEEGAALRYVHASGLIMRHDKKAFAKDAIEAARIGKMVGDYVRILTFTSYARALPWGVPKIKSVMDPFTGCFISRMPVAISWLRLAIRAASVFGEGSSFSMREGEELVRLGTSRLGEALKFFGDEQRIRDMFSREKAGWDLYYDTLNALEKGLGEGDQFTETLRDKAMEIVESWQVVTEEENSVGVWE